jgi:RNA polymerase sigma-70 factor, ECF subfamily
LCRRRAFSLQKFLNKRILVTVFMFEGKRVVAGEAILNGVTTGDRDQSHLLAKTLESLVHEHSRLVYRIAFAVLRSHHDAEDATQETFMRVLRYSSKLDQVEDPKTWLARIAWRVALDRSKRRGAQREIPLEDPENPIPEIASNAIAADENALGSQVSSILEKLIAALPAKLREPLILSTIDEMTPREIAATLAINEAAVRSRVFRARQILKEKLTQQLGKQGKSS